MNTPSCSELSYLSRQLDDILETIAGMARRAEDPATSTALHASSELLCAAIADLKTAQEANDLVIFGPPAASSEQV